MKRMKRVQALLLALCLTAAFPSVAFAENAAFNAHLDLVQNDDGSITVSIPTENAAILEAHKPTLSIPCTVEPAMVVHNGESVPCTADGEKVSFTVASPGSYVISAPVVSAKIKSFSLTLEGQIGLNYSVMIPEELQGSVHAVLVYKGAETVCALGSPLSGTTDVFRFTFRVPVKEIGNKIALKIVDESGEAVPLRNSADAFYAGNTAAYSVTDYCTISGIGRFDPNGRGEQLEALVAALQNYGAYALRYFGSGDTDPGFASSGADVSGVDVSGYGIGKDGTVTGLTQTSMFLTIESETTISLRYVLEEGHEIGEYRFSCGGKELTPEPNKGSYLIRLKNIPAKDLDTPYTVTVTRGDESASVTCSALTYAQLVLNNASFNQLTALCNTVKAMVLYNQAANAYFG